jgi:hypothetical protein
MYFAFLFPIQFLTHGSFKIDLVNEIEILESAYRSKKLESAAKTHESHKDTNATSLFDDMEPKVRQSIRTVGRTVFCFKCEGSKELASYYCACGSFLCALHLAEHSCLVSASLQYNEELIAALC